MTSLPTRIPELDKRAVRERLDQIKSALSISHSMVSVAFNLFSERQSPPQSRSFIESLDVLCAAEIIIERAEKLVDDLMNDPPTIPEDAVAAGQLPSSNQPESTL